MIMIVLVPPYVQATNDVLESATNKRVSLRLGVTTDKKNQNQQAIAVLYDLAQISRGVGELLPGVFSCWLKREGRKAAYR